MKKYKIVVTTKDGTKIQHKVASKVKMQTFRDEMRNNLDDSSDRPVTMGELTIRGSEIKMFEVFTRNWYGGFTSGLK